MMANVVVVEPVRIGGITTLLPSQIASKAKDSHESGPRPAAVISGDSGGGAINFETLNTLRLFTFLYIKFVNKSLLGGGGGKAGPGGKRAGKAAQFAKSGAADQVLGGLGAGGAAGLTPELMQQLMSDIAPSATQNKYHFFFVIVLISKR